ncbi:MAG: hypothetical protein ACTSYU_00250 [Promethearchaeota archaeon]
MKHKTHGMILIQATLIISAILFLISIFVPLTGEYSILQIYVLLQGNLSRWIYFIPWICGASLLGIGFFLPRWLRLRRIYLYVLLILVLNFEIVLINEVFQQHRSYVWQNTGIYTLIGAVAFHILGFIQILSMKSPQPEKNS